MCGFDHSVIKRLAITAIVLFAFILCVSAQGTIPVDPEIKKILVEADSCVKNKGKNCIATYRLAIVQAQKKYPNNDYLDYLHYKIARAYFMMDVPDSIFVYIDSALLFAEAQKSDRLKAEIYNVRGTANFMVGKNDVAISDFIQAATALEVRGDSIYAAYTYSNIGMSLGEVNDNERSVIYLEKAYRILQDHIDDPYLPTVSANLGLALYRAGDIKGAEDRAKWTLNHSDVSIDQSAHAIALYTLALLCPKDQSEKSKAYLEKALKLAESQALKSTVMGDILLVLSELEISALQSKSALIHIEKAIFIYQEASYRPGLNRAFRLAAQAASQLNQHALASDYWEKHIALNDTLQAEQTKKITQELTVQYETEKKDKELAQAELNIQRKNNQIHLMIIVMVIILIFGTLLGYLFRKNQTLKWKAAEQKKELDIFNALLLGEENERNRLSKELHDGAASMITASIFQIRAGLQDSVKEGENELSFQNAAVILEKTHSEIRRMAHNLMPLILEQKGLVNALKSYCYEMGNGTGMQIHFETNLEEPDLLSAPVQLIIYRIVQELVQNAFKYAQASAIWVRLQKNNTDLNLQIKDNGVGLQADAPITGIGLRTIQDRVSLLGGEMSFGNNDEIGFQADIHIVKAFKLE